MKETKVILETSSPLTTRDFVVLGPDRGMLVCRARVLVEDSSEHYVLVLPKRGEARDLTIASVRPLLVDVPTEATIVLVTDSQKGGAVALVEPEDEHATMQIAACVAVMRASWDWDESPVIAVMVNNLGYEVATRYDGEYWSALTCG